MKEHVKQCYEEIRKLRDSGLTILQIAQQLHVSSQTISNYLRGCTGVCLNDYGLDRRRKLTDEQIDELIRRKAAGERVKDIAAYFGVSTTCVEYYTLPGYADSINQASTDRRKHLLKTDKLYRDRNNKQQAERAKRRVQILNEILRNGEI